MIFGNWIILLLILTGALLSVILRKLTVSAAVTGCILAYFVFAGAGYNGLIMMAVFFIAAVLATSLKSKEKLQHSLTENKTGMRNAAQVIANAGAPALAGLLHVLNILAAPITFVIIAACFSSAIADTVSSEMGNAYGRKYFNILTLKKEERGLNGVVSIEGFLFGLAGSILIAGVYSYEHGWNYSSLIIIIAGTAGNITDSILGATAERKGYLNNNAVNFLNTSFAGLLAAALHTIPIM